LKVHASRSGISPGKAIIVIAGGTLIVAGRELTRAVPTATGPTHVYVESMGAKSVTAIADLEKRIAKLEKQLAHVMKNSVLALGGAETYLGERA
jgi:hypothetical protein